MKKKLVEWHKPPSVNLRNRTGCGSILLSVILTCTRWDSPFHRSLQRRQRVNSRTSQHASPLSSPPEMFPFLGVPKIKDFSAPFCRTCRFWARAVDFSTFLSKVTRAWWADFPQFSRELPATTTIILFVKGVYKGLVYILKKGKE